MYNIPVKRERDRKKAEKHCDPAHERVKVRLSILSYPINRDTRAIYFSGSYRPLEGPSRPSYFFPCHWSPAFTVNSHKSLKISSYLFWKAVGHTESRIFSRVSRVTVSTGRDSSRWMPHLYVAVCLCARARTKSYVTWKFQRLSSPFWSVVAKSATKNRDVVQNSCVAFLCARQSRPNRLLTVANC